MNLNLFSLFLYLTFAQYINCNQMKKLTGTVTFSNSCEQIEPNSIATIRISDVSIADRRSRKIGNFIFFLNYL
jgi:hypothetical protein